MSLRVLIAPDKFKGTLTAQSAAKAMARGWKKTRPNDTLDLLPISDGGDGFGEIISKLIGAKPRKTKTIDAAHGPIEATWWWEPKTKTAVIESAKVVGLAMLPLGKFHPFQLDTFGLGKILFAARELGCKHCLIGIGGSATNDGGFGMARALGWKFLAYDGTEITKWINLNRAVKILPPFAQEKQAMKITVAVDVQNHLLGTRGSTRVYGPQKGLCEKDFPAAESCLRKFAQISKTHCKTDFAKIPGAGAAGGLGFGLIAFVGAKAESGFEIFSRYANLENRLRKTDLVLTGEGAIDAQTLMGKGVGELALRCKKLGLPCMAIAGTTVAGAQKLFTQTRGLVEITSIENAKSDPEKYLVELSSHLARSFKPS